MLLEHTLLKPDATESDIVSLCKEAKEYRLFGVCVNPCFVSLAKKCLQGTGVKVVTVIGFPLGAEKTETKVFAARLAQKEGADEIDMVMNISLFKSGKYNEVKEDIMAVAGAVTVPLKVIIETCLLSDAEKREAVRVIAGTGAAYVKTSTGFSKGGATVPDVRLLSGEGGKYGLKVKASGGIKDLKTASAMALAGAERIGTSSGAAIAREEMEGKKGGENPVRKDKK